MSPVRSWLKKCSESWSECSNAVLSSFRSCFSWESLTASVAWQLHLCCVTTGLSLIRLKVLFFAYASLISAYLVRRKVQGLGCISIALCICMDSQMLHGPLPGTFASTCKDGSLGCGIAIGSAPEISPRACITFRLDLQFCELHVIMLLSHLCSCDHTRCLVVACSGFLLLFYPSLLSRGGGAGGGASMCASAHSPLQPLGSLS